MPVQEEQKRSKKSITSLFSKASAYELTIPLAWALAAGGFWPFIKIAEEVFEGETRRLDEAILLSLRNPADLADPIGPSWFEEVMRDFTALGGAILVALCLAVLGYLLLQKKRGIALFMAAAVSGGFILSSTLKSFFDRPRPDIVSHSTYVMSWPAGLRAPPIGALLLDRGAPAPEARPCGDAFLGVVKKSR